LVMEYPSAGGAGAASTVRLEIAAPRISEIRFAAVRSFRVMSTSFSASEIDSTPGI
jgi:hypothetical protein